jgi:hypothetical protein
MSDYRVFIEAFENLLTTIRGAATAPLTYIIRKDEEAAIEILAAWDYEETLCATLTLGGPRYKIDNKRVWTEFKALVVEGPAWIHVKRLNRLCDGRGAILALKLQMEGPNSFLLRRQVAYRVISSTYYRGHRQVLTFTDYIKKFLESFNELESCEEVVSESRKVTLFLDNITDNSLATAKSVVFGDRAKLESFQECRQYLSNMIASIRVHSNDKPSREVSQADTTSGTQMSEDGTTELSHLTDYEPAVWQSFSKKDRGIIHNMRRVSRGGGGRGRGRGRGGGRGNPGGRGGDRHTQLKRKLAALVAERDSAELERQIAAIESGTPATPPPASTGSETGEAAPALIPGSAGQQFGRGAHRNTRARTT